MKHIQNVTIILKSGRQVVLTSSGSGSPHSCHVGDATSLLPKEVIESLHMDVRSMDLNLDYLYKQSKR